MMPTLTILLIEDTEKPPAMTQRFFAGLRHLNASAAESVEIVAVTQRPDASHLSRAATVSPLPAEIIVADHPRAANGYPIWDICAAVRQVWDRIRGEYVTFAHPEFVYGPDRLERTVASLREHRPVICLGNLRRPGDRSDQSPSRRADHDGGLGDLVAGLLDAGDGECLRQLWPHLKACHWIFFHENTRDQGWEEDIFFARRDWFQALRFFEHEAGRMAFQDIYDLIRAAFGCLKERQLDPGCLRLPRPVNEALHLPHGRPRSCFSREVFEWFQARSRQWSGSAYLRPELWAPFLAKRPIGHVARTRSLQAFRRGVGGTVTRWESAFKTWLANGGGAAVTEYLQAGGAR